LNIRFQDDVDWVNEQFFNDKPVLVIKAVKANSQKQPISQKTNPIDPIKTILNWALEKISSARKEGENFILDALMNAAKSDLASQNSGIPDDFNSANYLMLNPDVIHAEQDARLHWINHGATEGRSYKFDLPYPHENSHAITVPVNINAHPVSITIRIDVSTQN
jgi:hypothetical protein